MEVFVETAAFTPLRHNRKIIFCHRAHEQQDVDMSGFPVGSKKITGHKNSDASSANILLMQGNRGGRYDQNLKGIVHPKMKI